MSEDAPRHRSCLVLRGQPEETARRAVDVLRRLEPSEVLWVSEDGGEAGPFDSTRPSKLRGLLGQSFQAVVLDFHDELDPDVLGRSHGLVWGGGVLAMRLPPEGRTPVGERDGLAAHPYDASDVGTRFFERFEARLRRAQLPEPDGPVARVDTEIEGTDEQAALAESLADAFEAGDLFRATVAADRGRGKSSALGLAVRRALDRNDELRFAVTAGYPDAALEVFRFATGTAQIPDPGPIRFVEATDLAVGTGRWDVILVDEAAQLPVPVLRRIARVHSDTAIVFATTTHGYEGTGRGFSLRFADWLSGRPVSHRAYRLDEPIRWDADDPLEAFVFDALLLDAEPGTPTGEPSPESVEYRRFDREALAADERRLRELFGLLIRAHYRTTPGDLRRMLDAPNLSLHGLLHRGVVVAATWVAEEGALPMELCDDLYRGRRRLLGHALPETFVTNLGHREAGRLEMRRSVRIAVHPGARRRGLGTKLVECVHEVYEPDLFGTLFGATPELLSFRRSVGYEIVRVGAGWGRRAGEPSVAMVRPVSEAGRALFERLREEYARKLPVQLALKRADGALLLDAPLERALSEGLPEARPPSERRRSEVLAHYAYGPRTYESAAHVVEPFVAGRLDALEELPEAECALIEARVRRRLSWEETREAAEMPSMRATMRGLRRGIRRLVERSRPELADRFGWAR